MLLVAATLIHLYDVGLSGLSRVAQNRILICMKLRSKRFEVLLI